MNNWTSNSSIITNCVDGNESSTEWHCDSTAIVGSSMIANGIIIIFNIIYLALLTRNDALTKLNYFWIVLHLTVADIFVGLLLISNVLSCHLNHLLSNWIEKLLVNVFLTLLTETAFASRHYFIGLAILERYCAICKPHDYCNIQVVNSIGKCAAAIWSCQLLLSCLKHVAIIALKDCYEDIFGDMHSSGILTLINNSVPFFMGAVLLIFLWKEMKDMSQTTMSEQYYQELRNAAQYVTFSAVVCYVFVIIPSAIYLLTTLFTANNSTFKWIIIFLQSFYGLVNILIYAKTHPEHLTKRQWNDLLKWARRKSRVSSNFEN